MVLLNLKSEMKDQLNKVGLVLQTGVKVFMNSHLQDHTTTTSQEFFFKFCPYIRLQKWNFRDTRILNSTSIRFLVLAPLCVIKILASFVLSLMCLCVLDLWKKLKKNIFFLKALSSITLAWLEKSKKISNMYIEMIHSFWNHDF